MKKEILIVATEFPPGPGGIGSHAFSMARALCTKGYRVTVVAPADYVTKEEVVEFDHCQNFTIIRYDRTERFHYLKRFRVASKHIKPNVILSGKFALWIGLWLGIRFNRNNRIAILHGSEVRPSNFFDRLMTHLSIASMTKVVAVSSFTKSLIPKWTIKNKEVSIVPNGINPEEFGDEVDKIELSGFPILLTVGNVTPRKGQHRVIKALPEILRKYPDAHYHIVGLPTYKEQFLQLAQSLDVEQAITFHGKIKRREDLYRFYRSSDVFIILSENQKDGDCEGFGIVVLEAGYFDLPSIGATGSGIVDAIEDGKSGYLVDGNNTTGICEALEKIMQNKDELRKGAKAFAIAHNWNTIINDIIKLFR
jgi:phosphatidylinositol alpha-1,6-mannosyltransferase